MGTPRSRPSSARRAHPSTRPQFSSPLPNGRSNGRGYTMGADEDAEGSDDDAEGEVDMEAEVEDVLGREDQGVDHDDGAKPLDTPSGRRSRSGRNADLTNGHNAGQMPSPSPARSVKGKGSTSAVPSLGAGKGNGKGVGVGVGAGKGSGVGAGKGKGKGGASFSGPRSTPILAAGSSEILHVAPAYTRDKYCSFCAGTDERNKLDKREKMNTCVQCGRSGHPSCMGMGEKLTKKVRTYGWVCMECKTCEVCEIKGDDERLMFCDGCDRGWHSYCVKPPMPKPPDDAWFCTLCTNGVAYHAPNGSTSRPLLPTSQSSRKGKERIIFDPSPTPSALKKRPHTHKSYAEPSLDSSPAFTPSNDRKRKDKRKRDSTIDDSPAPTPGPAKVRVKLRLSLGKARDLEAAEEEEEEKVPFGGIITGDDADTTRTSIQDKDKAAFERALQAAESALADRARQAARAHAQAQAVEQSQSRASPAPSSLVDSHSLQWQSYPAAGPSRSLRNHLLAQPSLHSTPLDSPSSIHGSPGPQGPPAALLASNQHKIKHIRFGKYDIDTWYNAPYPEEYQSVPDGRLWICEFCLKYMKSGFVAQRHRLKCKVQHPPGDEIYRAPIPDSPSGANVSVFEVDGRKNKIYCQHLCLLAKMFLDHKTLYYDVEPFLFYVMTEVDEGGARFVGYFSKEKRSQDNNVSCIMTLPVRQRKGWGQLLIDFSYALSKKEGRVGGPERPLSGLGEVTYKRYWLLTVFRYLAAHEGEKIRLEDISAATSLTLADIYSALREQDMITTLDTPPPSYATPSRGSWRGRGRGRGRPSLRKQTSTANSAAAAGDDTDDDPAAVKIPRRYSLHFDKAYVDAVLRKHEQKGYLRLQPDRLKYHPFLVSRAQQVRPGLLAKATLMGGRAGADGPGAGGGGGEIEPASGAQTPVPRVVTVNGDHGPTLGGNMRVDDLEEGGGTEAGQLVERGEDRATLDLVKKLSNSESPKRNLRMRSVGARESVTRSHGSQEGTPRRGRSARLAGEGRNGQMDVDGDESDDPIGGTPRTGWTPAKVRYQGAKEGQPHQEDGEWVGDEDGDQDEEDAEGGEEDAEGEEE